MSENVGLTPLQQKQWKIWKEGKNRGLIDADIAKLIHRSPKTVERLKRKAKQTGDYQAWVNETVDWAQEEFKQLHLLIKAKIPSLAYAWMGKLVEKNLVLYFMAKAKEVEEDNNLVGFPVTDYEDDILNKASRILNRKLREKEKIKTKPSEIH